MSEYQFVHFIAIDRPLDDEQLEFMQQQSTRATVTRREFTNRFTTSVAAELKRAFPRTNGLIAKLKEHGFLKK